MHVEQSFLKNHTEVRPKFIKCIDDSNRYGTIPDLLKGHYFILLSIPNPHNFYILDSRARILAYKQDRFEYDY